MYNFLYFSFLGNTFTNISFDYFLDKWLFKVLIYEYSWNYFMLREKLPNALTHILKTERTADMLMKISLDKSEDVS